MALPTFNLKALLRDESWTKALEAEFIKDYFDELKKKLQRDYESENLIVLPPAEKIFNAFNLTPLNKVRVVILGQDPYDDEGQAEGLSFSVPDGIRIPRSLANIFKELTTDIPGFEEPSSGSLVKWAQQGVLLLNSTLTVKAKHQNSHEKYGWQTFTDKVIQVISDQCPFVVFILWGNFAHKKERQIDGEKHVIIKTTHPSPMALRNSKLVQRFQGSKCFSQTNSALKKAGLEEIDWCL